MAELKVGRRSVTITHGDRIIFPRAKLSKNDLIDYYLDIADVMLPHMKNRLITMERFVDGANHPGFYQKDASEYFPSWIKTEPVGKKDGGGTAQAYRGDKGSITGQAYRIRKKIFS